MPTHWSRLTCWGRRTWLSSIHIGIQHWVVSAHGLPVETVCFGQQIPVIRKIQCHFECQCTAIPDDFGAYVPDEAPNHARPAQDAPARGCDVYIDVRAGQQPSRALEKRTQGRHVDYVQFPPGTEPDAGQRALWIG